MRSLICLVVILILSAACGKDPVKGTDSVKNMPGNEINASTAQTLCGVKGGQVLQFNPATGYSNTISGIEYGCDFLNSNGSSSIISAVTLFNYFNGQQQIAVNKFLSWANPSFSFGGNPASVNCSQLGGSSQVMTDRSGTLAYCVFSDGSKIEEWTLFRGPSSSPKLLQVLQSI